MDPLSVALEHYGLAEVPGSKHEAHIMAMARSLGADWYNADETSWCGIFMGHVHKECGYSIPDGPQTARNWLRVGKAVEDPIPGDVVVYWRDDPQSWKGHVGFFISQNDGHIFTLGGNQSNRVQISPYPHSELLGFRRLRPEVRVVDSEWLNVRHAPSSKAALACRPLADGTLLHVTEDRGDWLQVEPRIEGWVAKRYTRSLT